MQVSFSSSFRGESGRPVWQKTGPRLNCTVGRADARGVGEINTGDKFHADPRVLTVREAGKGTRPNQPRRES